MTSEMLRVEVVYALPERQWVLSIELSPGATVLEALQAAQRAADLPDVVSEPPQLAVWGRPVGSEHRLGDGDRLEVLRPLKIDPRSARRELAAAGQVMGSRTNVNQAQQARPSGLK